MALHANPLLYLNMGGEMLYVLQQRLKAQKIALDKSVQVLEEVSTSLLNPEIVARIFQQSGPIDLSVIRAILEKAVLSSIMRLDEMSMNKLFDLMTMMVKYQIQMATGPRELLLITLNHFDAMRDMPLDANGHQSLVVVHRMLLQLYGNLTYEELWQARQACLIELNSYNVRVSILLRLNLQKEDGSLIPPRSRHYNERYEERKGDLWNLRILENSCQGCNVGSLRFVGDRVTFLGTNVYIPSSKMNEKINKDYLGDKNNRKIRLPNGGVSSKSELKMLAAQLGTGNADNTYSGSSRETQSRPFTLQLFSDDTREIIETEKNIEERDQVYSKKNVDDDDDDDEKKKSASENKPASNNYYKAQLDNIYSDLIICEEKETGVERGMELLELMDQVE